MLMDTLQWADPGSPDGEFPFAGLLDPEELALLGRHVSWHRLAKGDFLWRQGDDDDRLGLVVDGRIELVKEMVPGRPLVIGLFGPGALVGDLSFAAGCERETSAKVREDLTVVLLSREGFETIACQHPALASRIQDELLRQMADQLRHAYARLAAIF